MRRLLLSALLVALFAAAPAAARTYVFVHGAWGGGWDWKGMEKRMEAAGHEAYRVTLTGLGERAHLASPDVDLDTHIQDVVAVLEFEELEEVVLVGHSYGGIVVAGVASRSQRVSDLVFIDALLLEAGESLWSRQSEDRRKSLQELADTQGDGWRIPPYWPDPGKDRPHPLATLRDPLDLAPGTYERVRGTYILTRDPGAESDAFTPYAERARALGYAVHELRTGHNPQRTMPEELAELLLGAAKAP